MLALPLVGLSFQSVSFLLLHYSMAPPHLDHQIQLLSTAHRSLTLTSNTLSYLLFHKHTYCLMLYAFHLLLSSLNTFLYLSHQGNPYSSFLCFLFFPILYGLTSFSTFPSSQFSGFTCQVLKDSSLTFPFSQPQLVPLPSP